MMMGGIGLGGLGGLGRLEEGSRKLLVDAGLTLVCLADVRLSQKRRN